MFRLMLNLFPLVTFFRGCEVVTCYLHGQCAGETLRAHEGLNEVEDMFVIIQFVRPSFDVDRMGG